MPAVTPEPSADIGPRPAPVASGRAGRAVGAPPVLLVIGAHRGELAFGEQVARRLDPATFGVLRIPLGLSGERPLPDEVPLWRRRHRDLYLQILDRVRPGQRLLIDLHSGIDELRRSADVFCAAPALLACIAAAPGVGDPVRGVRLVADTAEVPGGPPSETTDPRAFPLARPDLPAAVWECVAPRYVGVEVYVAREGSGSPDEHAFAARLLRHIAACALDCADAG